MRVLVTDDSTIQSSFACSPAQVVVTANPIVKESGPLCFIKQNVEPQLTEARSAQDFYRSMQAARQICELIGGVDKKYLKDDACTLKDPASAACGIACPSSYVSGLMSQVCMCVYLCVLVCVLANE